MSRTNRDDWYGSWTLRRTELEVEVESFHNSLGFKANDLAGDWPKGEEQGF